MSDGSLKVSVKEKGKGEMEVTVEVEKPKEDEWWYGVGFAETDKMVKRAPYSLFYI